jgi:hypothetical protein
VWRAHSSLSKKKLPVLDNYWLAAFFIQDRKISTANIDISTFIFDEIKIKQSNRQAPPNAGQYEATLADDLTKI